VKANSDDAQETTDPFTLPPKQELAVNALVCGKRAAEAAAVAGVTPRTLRRWIRDDARFAAVLNSRLADFRGATIARLNLLADSAVVTVAKAVIDGDAKVGMHVLRGLGFFTGKLSEIGPTDAQTISDARARQEMLEASLADVFGTNRQ
jgi:hypothetical protein